MLRRHPEGLTQGGYSVAITPRRNRTLSASSSIRTSGSRSGSGVEILSGLNAGETIASPIPVGLSDGVPAEVRP